MVYLETINEQAILFLETCGFGFLLGALYEVFRTLRIVLTKAKYMIFWDALYMIVSSVLTFLFLLIYGNGKLRAYIFLAIVIGWTVYYLTLGPAIGRAVDLFVVWTKRFFDLIFRVLTAPFVWVLKILKRPFGFFKRISKKILKKVPKKLKFHLKFTNVMLYNSKR